MDKTRYYVKLPDGCFVSFDNPYEFAMFSGTKYTFMELLGVFVKIALFMLCSALILWAFCSMLGLFFC